jgi:hypothetical protein
MIDILDICAAQVGKHERADGSTEFGEWLDAQPPVTRVYAQADWCAASVLRCISLVPGGLDAIGGLHKDDAYVQNMHNRLRVLGLVDGNAGPRQIVFYNWRGTGPEDNHVGIVKSVSGRTLKVYEGNHNNRYELVTRAWDSQVTGFANWWPHVKQPVPLDDDTALVVSLSA